ncbi:MAG: FAD binding domain-containing protein, partial [Coriobacteriales bacterium]|nr:FAD binding domain-containing protein [Coriobacteriales bacterium]
MKYFEYATALDFKEASQTLADDAGARALAGGTDLLSVIKNELYEQSPSLLLDIKRIEGATGITSEGNIIHIGALTKLSTIAQDATINAA